MSDLPRARAERQVEDWLAFHGRVEVIPSAFFDGIEYEELEDFERRRGLMLPIFYKAVMARVGLCSGVPAFVDGFELGVDYAGEIIERAEQSPPGYFFVGANAQILNEYAAYYDLDRPSADRLHCEIASMIVDPYTGRILRNVPMFDSLRDLLWLLTFRSHWISTRQRHVECMLEAPLGTGAERALRSIAASLELAAVEGPGPSVMLFLGEEAALAVSRAPRQTQLRVLLGGEHEEQLSEAQARLDPWISSARQSRQR